MNIKDIAQLAGVSTSTVSKIVNHRDASITAATRDRVLELVRKYHYTPYGSSKPNTTTWRIGVLLSSSISMDSTLDGIIQQAQKSGYGTLVFNSYGDHDQEERNILAALEHRVDGLVWEPVDRASLPLKSRIEAGGIPELTIGPLGDDKTALMPYEEAAYSLTEELIKRRHTSIACLLAPGRRTQSFLHGYRRCLFDHNLPYHADMVLGTIGEDLTRVLENRHVTGVVASHYHHALEFLQFAESMHYRLPQDLSLVSLMNDTNVHLRYPGSPEISSYIMRNADFGAYLCRRIIHAIEHESHQSEAFDHVFALEGEQTVGRPPDQQCKKIVVVGSINVDTYLTASSLPKAGMTTTTRNFASTPGGKATNQAVGVARLRHQVSLIGNVGSDPAADYIYKTMRQAHVDATGVRRVTGADTGKAYIFVDSKGESMISLVAGANESLTPDDITARDQIFRNTGYCLIQTEIPMDTVAEACRTAKRHHAATILKPSSCDHLPEDLLNSIDILIPNFNELNTLIPGPGSVVDKAKRFIDGGIGKVIITLGERGCTLVTANGHKDFPAHEARAVDDTGASDAFISALASYLCNGCSLDKAARIANLAAGFSVAHEGVIPSLISRRQLEGLID